MIEEIWPKRLQLLKFFDLRNASLNRLLPKLPSRWLVCELDTSADYGRCLREGATRAILRTLTKRAMLHDTVLRRFAEAQKKKEMAW
ncbi:MAG: hypothetical protein U0934_05215 [Pseudotabrizicola sp.]|uniref:hypothetical protein n=1 Tax=Pseudotabrizicola sp. TaxID=2939647 RepID=UPI002730C97C|nr:hypothetical protein [Pseudotabrizicola sp.]MDP2080610.1 hypothetical protein [Pseudotabrizicola sp.]MDZ7573338.1 hypothetical protein [Pseudotabrizicola sp.]